MGHGQGENAADGWRGQHAVAYEAEQERMHKTDGKAVIGEAAKKDGEADMQLHGQERARPKCGRMRHWRGWHAVA